MPIIRGSFDFDYTIDLHEEGLQHSRGRRDCDGSDHLITVSIDPEDYGFHYPGDCLEEWQRALLQELHETAHPRGAVFVENCTERICQALISLTGD
jgi:hypothetical protein